MLFLPEVHPWPKFGAALVYHYVSLTWPEGVSFGLSGLSSPLSLTCQGDFRARERETPPPLQAARAERVSPSFFSQQFARLHGHARTHSHTRAATALYALLISVHRDSTAAWFHDFFGGVVSLWSSGLVLSLQDYFLRPEAVLTGLGWGLCPPLLSDDGSGRLRHPTTGHYLENHLCRW